MKTKIIKFLKIFLWFSSILVLSICLYLGYVFSKFNQDIDDEIITEATQEIRNANQLDARVLGMYDRIYDNATHNTSIKHAWKTLLGNKIECPCLNVTRNLTMNHNHRKTISLNAYTIATRLETKVSQVECLNFYLQKFDFLSGGKGIEEAAVVYFDKPISELNNDELIGLIIMQENPSLFNPKRKKERFDRKVSEVKNGNNLN